MNKKTSWTVVIVGLGHIGLLYDLEFDDLFLTHVKGFSKHENFRIVGLVDQDKSKLELANQHYPGIPTYKSINDLEELPDLMVLASVPKVNHEIYNNVKSESAIKHFLIEKPFWDGSKGLDLNNVDQVSINYIRKYLPATKALKDTMLEGKWGKLININVVYSKGLSNIGSHFIDLIFYLTESTAYSNVRTLTKSRKFEGYSFSFDLGYNGNEVPAIFTNVDLDINFYEIDLIFENHRVKLEDLDWLRTDFDLNQDIIFKQTKTFNNPKKQGMRMYNYSHYVADHLDQQLQGHKKNISNLENEKNIFQLIKEVKDKHGKISN